MKNLLLVSILLLILIIILISLFKKKHKKIAFCFLIYDKINHEELWNKFFNNINQNKYNIYIHYKDNKPLKYFDKYKLKNCIETEYAKLSLVKASNLLFEEAYKDSSNYKFILLSNSCIPLKNFDYIYNKLTKDNNSYFNEVKHNVFPNCKSLLKIFNKDNIKKSAQWIILNREHVKTSLDKSKEKTFNSYNNLYAPDEIYYLTTIYNFNNKNIITTDYLSDGATTFTNWFNMNYKFGNGGVPANYSNISEEELNYLLKEAPCLFGRKFNENCTVDEKYKLHDKINY